MIITLDFGNTSAHAAFFKKDEMIEIGVAADILSWLEKHHADIGDVSAILCEVRPHPEALDPLIQKGLLVEKVKDWWRGGKFAGMPVHYSHSLGEDRLIAAWGAYKRYTTPTLVIDAGTFITLDIVTPEGFMGGHILPGLGLIDQSLKRGANLQVSDTKFLSKELITGDALPHETSEALLGGHVAVIALIQRLLVRWPVGQVLLTGGDSPTIKAWMHLLNPTLPLHLEENLLHHSLMSWYKRNVLT